MSKLKVAVRIRPLIETEIDEGHEIRKLVIKDNSVHLQTEFGSKQDKYFQFDSLLDPSSTQGNLFEQLEINHAIERVVEGYHATVFAYG